MILTATVAIALIKPNLLRCEALVDPEGVNTATPRLSWQLLATKKGLYNLSQSKYRILVSGSLQRLAKNEGDLWDSGSVKSSNSVDIRYSGKKLTSGQHCFWKVQVADQAGNLSPWSKPSKFSVGLLKPQDWQAKWIGFDKPLENRTDDPFKLSSWIWSVSDAPLVRNVVVDQGLQSAIFHLTADDQFRLYVNDKLAGQSDGRTDAWRRPQQVDVTALLRPGSNDIRIEATNSDGDGKGVLGNLILKYGDGPVQQVVTDHTWPNAKVLGAYGAGPWGKITASQRFLPPPRILHREFQAPKKVKRAVLRASALGLFEIRLNGKTFTDEVFMPGWTDYTKRVHARSYDVTAQIAKGLNNVEVVLGDGWYSGHVGYGGRRDLYGSKIRALVQLELEFTDGTKQVVASDENWQARTGPIFSSDFLDGEHYDASFEQAKYKWEPVDVGAEVKPMVEPFPGQPVRPYAWLKPKSITKTGDDVYVLDLGQNIAGWAKLNLEAKPGQKLTLRFAERLNPDGTIYVTNLRAAKATDSYVSRGGRVNWEPKFTFHGFQYIEITGLGRKPMPEEIVGVALSSDTPTVGKIETSNPMLNKLVSNAWWTQRMNFIDVPTDCPQRDERLGWTGDAQAYIRTACMLTDAQPFFTKWLEGLEDAQRADGQFPMVSPLKVAEGDGGPAWADAGVICPWTIYDVYGDKDLLAARYESMKKFVEFCVKRSPNLMPPAQFHCFGDWLSINAPTANEVIYMAYFAGSSQLVSKAAAVLGKKSDAEKYQNLYQKVKANFQKAYVSADGKVGYGNAKSSQCGSVLALAFDLVDGALAKKVADGLVADIESRGWHLSTGFVGTRDIMHVLSKIGRDDVAFRLLHNKTFPSWGFTIENGATSIWERWDGWTPEKGFQDPGMNSFAHYAFGAVVGWMMEHPAGISNLKPGFSHIKVAPKLDPNCAWLKSHYDSVRGKIVSEWSIKDGKVAMKVVIPPNTKATVTVPVSSKAKISVSPAWAAKQQKGNQFELGSGEYTFNATR